MKTPKSEEVLTSVKVNPKQFEEFKVNCVKYKFSHNKLANRTIYLYNTDPEFRKMITNLKINFE